MARIQETISKDSDHPHLTKDYVETPLVPFLGLHDLRQWSFYRAVVIEFIATLLFLYVTIATIVSGHNESNQCSRVGLLGISWVFGGTIFILVYCTAGISGGHINPAVTFGLVVARKVSVIRAILYMAAQCLGAITGVSIVKGIVGEPFKASGGGANYVHEGYGEGAALGAEIMGTFVLVYTVLSATDPKTKTRDSHVPVLAPLAIGFAVLVANLSTIPITGAGINPARSLGTAVILNESKPWLHHWIFWVGPFVGAMAAALCHQLVLGAEAAKIIVSIK